MFSHFIESLYNKEEGSRVSVRVRVRVRVRLYNKDEGSSNDSPYTYFSGLIHRDLQT